VSGLHPALRLARRDVRHSRGRSLLIVAMVALPVFGAAFLDVVLRTADVRGAEQIELELGRTADARVVSSGAGNPVLQRPDEASGLQPEVVPGPGGKTPPEVEQLPAVDPLTLLPAGTRAITDGRAEVTVRTEKGVTSATLRELDYTDPLARGLYKQVDGRAPRDTTEVAVTTPLLDKLGRSIGDQLEVTRPERALTIVGTVRPNSERFGTRLAVALPGALPATPSEQVSEAGVVESLGLFVDTPSPLTWPQVLQLNEAGIAAFSRSVVEDPPARAEVPLYQQGGFAESGGPQLEEVLAVVLVVGLGVAEVALLSGAAFAVGIRRQSRTLGLLAAAGAHRRQVRAVVLAQGLVLGGLGGLAGVALGAVGALVALQIASSGFDRFLPPPDLRPLELLALTLIGVCTGLLAAALPARTAARRDVLVALTGRRGVVRARRRYPVLGLITSAVGAAMALGGGAFALALQSRETQDESLLPVVAGAILLGAVLTQLGLIVATPALVGAAARLGRVLPLAPRLALRDAARHRGRSAPAVAAVLAAVAGSVALTLYVASMSDKDRREYVAFALYGQSVISAQGLDGGPRDTAPLVDAVRRIAPPDDVFDVRGFPRDPGCSTACRDVQVVAPPQKRCPVELLGRDGTQPTQEQIDRAHADPRCMREGVYFSTSSGPAVGTYDDFVRLTGIGSAAAREVLASGGMVVFDENLQSGGKGSVEITTFDTATGEPGPVRYTSPPTVVVPVQHGTGGYPTGFLSPQAAEEVGIPVAVQATVLSYDVPPSDDVEEEVSAALADIGEEQRFQVERGYRDNYGLGLLALLAASALVTLGAAGVATGLAQADARADLATLAAIGAAPRLRRRLTAFQAGVIAGLGALLGTVSGFVPVLAYLEADSAMRFVPPWANLAAIVLVVPAVAALAAFCLTRSRLPLARRTA